MQLIMNILSFFWELIMQKSTPGDGKPTKSERFRKLILFFTVAGLLIYSAVITERLYRITRSFIEIAKESSKQKDELLELTKQLTELGSVQNQHAQCQMLLSRTQSNLEICLTNRKPAAPGPLIFPSNP